MYFTGFVQDKEKTNYVRLLFIFYAYAGHLYIERYYYREITLLNFLFLGTRSLACRKKQVLQNKDFKLVA